LTLNLAFGLLCATAVIGTVLAILYAKGPVAKPPPLIIPAAHGALGTASLIALILVLRRGLRQNGMGIAGFGVIAGGLLALALFVGLLLARATWQRRRPHAMLVGTHASLAVAGLVMLLALVALG
jgi:hypothetical protein